ncbi:MAG: hypothetical protein IPF47_19845 [Gemmatimonadetes bacterium]|nr:hypothetical protein [Gemmatimonadota bacterium]
MIVWPRASKTLAPAGTARAVPNAVIRPPSMMIVAFSRTSRRAFMETMRAPVSATTPCGRSISKVMPSSVRWAVDPGTRAPVHDSLALRARGERDSATTCATGFS